MDSFPSTVAGSSKRARTPNTGGPQPVSCMVDGCNSDLTKCRDYHRRHKVCEMHSKTPRVTIGGREQRFCQQCSRFHSLGEFDEGKRSCRKRLEGHNRRRRKPQPVTLPINHGNFPCATQGSRYFPLGNQPMIPTSSSVVSSNTMWCGGVKNENHHSNPAGFYGRSSVSGSYLYAYRSRLDLESSAEMGNGGNFTNNNGRAKLLRDGMANQVMNTVSDRALSLLSSSPAGMGLGCSISNGSPINPTRPMIPYLGPQRQGLEGEPAGTWGSRSNDRLCQDILTGEDNGSSSSARRHEPISFSWE